MRKYLLIMFTAISFLAPGVAFSEAGYRPQAWGSKTWNGPGRPPHWSPAPVQQAAPEKPVAPGAGVRPPYRPGGADGYWKHSSNRRRYFPHRGSSIVYFREPQTQIVVIEREKPVEVIVPLQRRPSRVQCAGQTTTRVDAQTGEAIIEYVSSAGDCP